MALREDLEWAQDAVSELVTVDLTTNERDALISLVYNVGATKFENSKALKHLNEGDKENFLIEAFSEKKGFTKAGGKRIQGLINRRANEQKLFLEKEA